MNTESPIKVAVVTGGHSYDVPNFHRLFRGLPGIDATIQHMDDFASSPEETRDGYDAVVFYIMLTNGPTDEVLPWHAGKPKTALEHLGTTKQGIVILHHGLLAYPQWDVWNEIVGMPDRSFGFYHAETLRVHIADPSHPITAGLSDFEMVDETYTMADVGPGNHALLTVDHPRSMKTIGWTRAYRNARVFCFESGHDNLTWPDPNFRELLCRGIRWTAGL